MYALCPKCNSVVKDPGKGGILVCKSCSHVFSSRILPEALQSSESRSSGEIIDKDSDYYHYVEHGEPLVPRKKRTVASSAPSEKHIQRDAVGGRMEPPAGFRQPDLPYRPDENIPLHEQDSILLMIKNFFVLIISFFTLIGVMSFFIYFFFNLISLGPTLVLVLPELMNLSPDLSPVFIFIPTLTPPFTYSFGQLSTGYPAVLYFIGIVAAIFLSVFWMAYTEGREAWFLFKRYGNNFQAPPLKTKNSFFLLPQVFIALFFFNIFIVLLFIGFGVTPETPESLGSETPLWSLMYQLANASVWEELVTRVLFIGAPLAFFEIMRRVIRHRKKTDMIRFFLGGKMELGFPELFFIVFSAFVFGLAHISGWDYWKFAPTFISGLVFGYLFIAKGLHIAILLHFAFDYLIIPVELFNPGLFVNLLIGLLMLFFFALGFFLFIYYCYQTGLFAVDKIKAIKAKA